jgi:mannose-6-phosphate isomerase
MGTHPNGPASLEADGRALSDWLAAEPARAGPRTLRGELPFLFKVLSVRCALSIQAHPDEARAARLHAARPDVYRDPHHKPEMAIALTEFHALCGFAPR